MQRETTDGFVTAFFVVYEFILWIINNLFLAFYHLGYALSSPSLWLDWSDKKAVMRFVYYGGSKEFFFVIVTIFLIIFFFGIIKQKFMWRTIRVLENFANTVGRFFAWAGLIMVLQQVIIVIMQRIFTRPDIVLAIGIPLQFDISWYAEELKLYNAAVITLCAMYTFVQGGHVRVDLIYAGVQFKTKKMIDMFGSVFFMMPTAVLIWMYGWFFLWRHLIVPKPSASDTVERLINKSRALRWNVETIGFSPNGFTGYFLFKILLVAFAGMVFVQAWAFLFRSFQEWREGDTSENKYLDKDTFGDLEEVSGGPN